MNLFCHIAGPFMVVVTGYTGSSNTDSTQVVNLNTNGNDCKVLAPYKYSMNGGAGGLLNHQLVICGGYSSGYKQACYKYNTISQDWTLFATLKTGRVHHAATTMSDGSLWFTGKTISIYDLYAFFSKIGLFLAEKKHICLFSINLRFRVITLLCCFA